MRSAPAVDVDQAAAEWIGRVQHMCSEEVLAACPFAPPRAEVNSRAAGLAGNLAGGMLGGFLVRKAEKAVNKGRAGGLPQSFVLAITPTHVRVYESSYSRKGIDVRGEVQSWDRAGLFVTGVDRGSLKTNVKIQRADGVELTVSAGTHPYTDRFIEMLSGRS